MIAASGPACTTEEAFEQMVLEYQMPLKRMCYMYLHDMSLAEDAVQETFLKVYRSLPQFGGGCSVKTWIMKIGVNTCRDMLRSAWFRHHDRRIVPEELPIPAEENLQPEEGPAEETGDYPHWNMPELTVSAGYPRMGGFPLGFAIPHVAPDDPCPCGSGLRYAHCHGKYLS